MRKEACSTERRRGDLAKTVLSWLLVAVWAALIFKMSAQQSTGLSTGFFGQVKHAAEALLAMAGLDGSLFSVICHFGEYAVLGALLANALRFRLSWKAAFVAALLCASVYGVTDEFHQFFVPGRVCDPLDWLTDTAGAALGSLACAFALRRRRC